MTLALRVKVFCFDNELQAHRLLGYLFQETWLVTNGEFLNLLWLTGFPVLKGEGFELWSEE